MGRPRGAIRRNEEGGLWLPTDSPFANSLAKRITRYREVTTFPPHPEAAMWARSRRIPRRSRHVAKAGLEGGGYSAKSLQEEQSMPPTCPLSPAKNAWK